MLGFSLVYPGHSLRFKGKNASHKEGQAFSQSRMPMAPTGPSHGSASKSKSLDLLFNFPNIEENLKKAIANYKNKPLNDLEPVASKFRAADHPALFNPQFEKPGFYTRTPDLNQIPLFFSSFDTEVAKTEEIKKLSPWEKAMASTRLIAKRLINVETGRHFLSNLPPGQAVNTLKTQDWPIRAIRAQAATATVDRHSGKYIQDLYDKVLGSINFTGQEEEPVPVYMVQPAYAQYSHDYAVNFLAVATQSIITDTLNDIAKRNRQTHLVRFSDDKSIPTITRTARTHSGPIGRLTQQGAFDTTQIQDGDHMVIVDDHCQAGGAILSMAAAIKQAGGKVLAAIVPTTHPFSKSLCLSPEVRNRLENTLAVWDPDGHVEKKLNQFGLPLETLTNHEALIIMAYATDPSDKKAVQQFQELETSLYGNDRVLEGASDSLTPILNQKPATAQAVVQFMEADNLKNRKVIKPVPFKNVHVLSHDKVLRDEKGMNYQLMHNALAAAAGKYEKRHSFLRQLANQVETVRQQPERYRDGMPLLCMKQDDFKNLPDHYPLDQDALLTDLLTHLEGLDPQLKKQFDTLPGAEGKLSRPNAERSYAAPLSGKKTIENILRHEFRRQYQQMLNPPQKPAQHLPFSKSTPLFTPQAQPLLDKLRRPENYVILRTDSPRQDVEKEINGQGWAHYFDVISGASGQPVGENGKEASLQSSMAETISQKPYLNGLNWHFWNKTPEKISSRL